MSQSDDEHDEDIEDGCKVFTPSKCKLSVSMRADEWDDDDDYLKDGDDDDDVKAGVTQLSFNHNFAVITSGAFECFKEKDSSTKKIARAKESAMQCVGFTDIVRTWLFL